MHGVVPGQCSRLSMEAIHAGLGALGARRWARRKRATAVTCVATAVAPTARAWFNRGAGAPNGVDEHCLQLSSLDNNSDAGSKLLVSNIERASGAKSSKTCLSQPETTSREARLRKTHSFLSRCSSPEHCFRMAVFITSNFDQTLFLGF